MSQRVKRWAVVVLAAGAALAAGCMPPTRVEFIEKLAKENRKIARSTRDFRKALLPLAGAQSQHPNPSEVHSAYDAMQKTLKEVKGDMAHQMLPPSSSSAKDFLQAYKDYLDAEQAILDGPMKAMVDEVDAQTETDDQRRDFIWGAKMAEVQAQETAAFAKLTGAQSAYTNEHNYQTYGLEDYVNNEKSGKQ